MELDSDEEVFFGPVTTPELRARARKGLRDNDKTLVNFSFHFSSESDTEDEKDSLDSGGGLKLTDANPSLHHKDSPYDLDASADISSNKGYFQDSLQTLEGSESSLMSLERKGKRVASTPMNRNASLSPDSLDCTLHESHDDSCDITDGSFTHANFKEYFICPSGNRSVKLTDWVIPSVDSTSLAQADIIELDGNKIDFNLKPNDLCFSSQKGTPVIKCINRSLGNGLSIAAFDSKGLQLAENLDSNLLLEKPTETMTAVNRLPPVNTVNTVPFDTSSLHQLSTPDLSIKEIQQANTSNPEYSLQNDMKNNAFRDGNLELKSADIESCILDVHGPASQNLQVRKKPLSEEPCQSTLDENSVMDEQLPLYENINVMDVESYENVPIQEFAAYSPNTPSREVAGATSILKDSGFLDVSAVGTTSTMNGVSSSSNFLTMSAACNMVRGFNVSGNSDSGADTSTKNSSALHISNLGDENMLEVKVLDFNVLNISTASEEILSELKIEPLDIGVETQNRSNDLITDTSIKSSGVLHISNLEDANENTLEVKGSDFNVSDISSSSEEILSELKIEPLDIGVETQNRSNDLTTDTSIKSSHTLHASNLGNENALEVKGSDFNVSDISTASEEILSEIKIELLDIDVETQNRSNDLTTDTSIKNSSALYISNLGDANENALEVEVSDFNVSNISTASEEILPELKNEPLDIDIETQNRSDDLALCNESDSHVTHANNDTVLENSAHFYEQEENHEVISMDLPEGQMIYVDIHADEEPKVYEDALMCGDTIDVDENLECAQDNGQGGEAECNANNNLSKERAIECEESRSMQKLNASMITIEKFMSSETFQEDSEILSEDSIIQEDAHCMEHEDTLATLCMSTAECIQGSESEDRKKEECETRITNHIHDPTVFQDENQGLLQDKSDMSLIKVLHDSQLDNSCLLEESVSQNERKAGQDFEGTGRVAIDDVQQRLIYTDFTIARETMIQDASDFIQEQDGDPEKSTRCGLHVSDMSLTCLETGDCFNITKFNVQHLSEYNQFVPKDDGNISQDANSNDIVEESNPTDHTLENITVQMEDHENGKDCEHATLQNNFNAAQELGDHLMDGTTQEIVDPDVISQGAEYHDVNDVTNEKNQENCSFSQESKDNVCETTKVIIDNEVLLSIEVDSSKEVTAEVDIQGTNDKIIVEMVEQIVHDVGILTKCPSIQVTEDINFLEVSNFNRVLEDSVNETSCIELSLTVDETRQVGNAENQQENHGFIQELEDSSIDEIEVINKIARQPEEQCCTNEMSEKFDMQESSSFASEAIEENYLNFNDDEDCLELNIQKQSLMTPKTAVDDSGKSQHFNDSCTRTDSYVNDITETLQELSLTLEVESNGQNEFQETRKIELEAKNDIAGNECQIVDDIGEEGIIQEDSSMYNYLQDFKVCEHKSLTSESIQMTVKAIPEKQEIHNGCDVIADDAENASCLIYSQDLFPEQHEKVPAPKTGGHDLNQNSDELNDYYEESVENDPSPILPILHCINDNLEDSSSISDENRKEESLMASFLDTFDRNLKISDISVSNVKQEARIEAVFEKKIFTTKFIKNFTLQSDNLEILKAFDSNDSQEIPNSPHVDNSLEESSPRSISVMGEVLDDLKMEDKDSGSGDLSFISNICMVDELSFDEENRLRKLKDLRSAENSKNSSFISNSSENPPNENSTLQNENFDDEIRKVVKNLVDKAVLQTNELSNQLNSNCVLEIPNDASGDCPLNVNDVESGAHEDFPTISLESSCFSYNDVTKMNRSPFYCNLQKDMEHKFDDQFIRNNGNCSTLFENSPSLNAELYNKFLNNSNSLLQSTLNERSDIFSPCISNFDSKLHEQSFDSFSIAEMTQLLNNTCNTSRIEDEVLFNSSKCVSSSAAKPSAVDDGHGLSLFPLSDIAETIVCSARKASHITMRPSSVKQSSSHKRMVKLIDGSGMVGEILNSGSKIGREAASVEEPIFTDVKKCLFDTNIDFIDGEELDLDEGLNDILARMSNSPVQKCESPAKKCGSPAKKCESPAKKCESPAKKCESPAKKCGSPAKKCESPAKKCKSPVKKCESLYLQSKPVKAIPKTPVSKGGNTSSYTSSFKKPSQNAKPYISSSACKENVPVTKNVTRFGISKTPNEKPKKTAGFISKSLDPPRFCKKTVANEISKPNKIISSLKRPILPSKTPPKIGKVLSIAKTELTSSQNLTTPSKVIPKTHPTQHSALKSRFGFCPEKAQSIASSLPRKTAKNLTSKKYLNIQSPVGKYIQESPASPLIRIVKADDGKAFTLPKTHGQSIDVPSHDLWTTSKTGIPILPPAKYTTKVGRKPIVQTTLLKPKPVLKVRNTPAPVVTKHIGSSKVVEGHNYLANEESLLDLSEQGKSIKPPSKYQCDMDTTLVQEVEIVHSNTLTKSLKKVK